MTPTTGFKETMKYQEVANFLASKGLHQTIDYFKSEAIDGYVCDKDGNMDAAFICRHLTIAGDSRLFRELQSAVTTYVSWS